MMKLAAMQLTQRDGVTCGPAVAVADGSVNGEAQLIGKDGKAIVYGGAPNLGFSIARGASPFNPLSLVEGSWPKRNEVVVDKSTAHKEHFTIGDYRTDFSVFDEAGELLANVKQVKQRALDMALFNGQDLNSGGYAELEVSDTAGNLMLRVVKPRAMMKPTMFVRDPHDNEIGRIELAREELLTLLSKPSFAISTEVANAASSDATASSHMPSGRKTCDGMCRAWLEAGAIRA